MKNKSITWRYLCLILLSTLVNATFAQQPLVAVGTWSQDGVNRPLIAVSQDRGISWSYPASANQQPLPNNFSTGELNRTFCKNHICIAAGNWMDKNSVFRPLLALSKDDGSTWNYLDMLYQEPVLSNVSFSKFQDVTCTDTFCLAAGIYKNTDKLTLPLLARGEYQPTFSWTFLTNNIQPVFPDNFYEGQFYGVHCNKHTCIAAGEYSNQEKQRLPWLVRSDKTGSNWKTSILNFPADLNGGYFQGIQCYESLCIAAGNYLDGTYTKPLLMKSTDQGKTWHSASIPMPENHKEGMLAQISCEKEWCIAAGMLTEGYRSWPFLVYSNDTGAHWHYSEYVSHTGLPETFFSGELTYTACNSLQCIAVGSYETHAGSHPLLVVSQDKGKTWHYSSAAQQSSPLALDEDGIYAHAFCNDYLCLATGEFLDTTGVVSPLLTVSGEEKEGLRYPENIIDNLPADLESARFFGAG